MSTLASTEIRPYWVTGALLRTAGEFLDRIEWPCERYVAISPLSVVVMPCDHQATVEDRIEMVCRAADFLGAATMVEAQPEGRYSFRVQGLWSEVPFEVSAWFDSNPISAVAE